MESQESSAREGLAGNRHPQAVLLPGYEDFDQHYTTARQMRWLPSYELNEATGHIEMFDPVWGECTIGDWVGDEIFAELYRHPVFQRLTAIEQLTLPKHYATMPGSVELTRWEHAWGSMAFVRRMVTQAEEEGRQFTDREKIVLQLRTFLSDAGHTAFSHLGDWLKQGFGGAENSHDEELLDYLELSGVCDILRCYGLSPEEVIFPCGEDWIECASPKLCVDRVDYGVREILRWVDPNSGALWRDAFRIDEQNQLVMRDQNVAKYFGLCFGLLATEHWSQPVHRLQLQFFGEMTKAAVLEGTSTTYEPAMHLADRLYTIDGDLIANMRSIGDLNNDLHALMLDIARAQRRIFCWGKEAEMADFLSPSRRGSEADESDGGSFLQPLEQRSWRTEYSGVKPQNIELIPVDTLPAAEALNQLPYALEVVLPALKPRAIDPLFVNEQGITRQLSETDEDYQRQLEQIKDIQRRQYITRIHLAPDAVASLRDKIDRVRTEWEQEIRRERTEISRELLQEKLEWIGVQAIGRRLVNVQVAYA